MANSDLIVLNKNNFEDEVMKAKGPVLVDFWAAWCGPCRAIAPVIEELSKDYSGKVKICKLNVDENNEIFLRFRLMSIPTIMVFKDGQQVEKLVDTRSKVDFSQILDKYL